ncbi:MAG TPA: hypothetical protein VKU19_41410 [Bryobacteraceae bacterium]|nr:hypothetical protein [Bryobacteraceae bacterium]
MRALGVEWNLNAMFPQLLASPYQADWLMPLVRRYRWHRGQEESGGKWLDLLGAMTSKAIWGPYDVKEADFLELAEQADSLPRHCCNTYHHKMRSFFSELAKRGPLTPILIAAAQKLIRNTDGTSEYEVYGWALFQCEAGLESVDSGWAAHIQRELFAMPKKDRTLWMRAFALEKGSFSSRSAVDRIGKEQLEKTLRHWIDMLGEDGGTDFSPVAAVLLLKLIFLCQHLGGHGCDDLLYRIAKAPWKRIQVPNWMATYLPMLDRRPKDRAFACLEALMMNPVTADRLVRIRYEALLTAFGAREIRVGPVGADGYPLDRDPNLEAEHKRIDQLLQMAVAAVAQGPWPYASSVGELNRLRAMREEDKTPKVRELEKKLENWPYYPLSPEVRASLQAATDAMLAEFAGNMASLNRAVLSRAEWITTHQAEFNADVVKVWREIFYGLGCEGGLVHRTAPRVEAVSPSSAENLSLNSVLLTLRLRGGNAFELTRQYVEQNGWTRELVEAFHRWIALIGTAQSDQMFRATVEWFVWFENICPIDMDACWSHRVKSDLRQMSGAEAGKWHALLQNQTFVPSGKPPMKWMTAAKAIFKKMDRESFRRRFVSWFEPFAKNEAVRITVTGRNLLRLLMWYVLVAEDSVVDDALTGFAKAKWKTKESAKRAPRAEMAFSYVLSQRAPLVALPILEEQVASGRAFLGSETQKIYEALCKEYHRQPVPAIPEKVAKGASPQTTPTPFAPALVTERVPKMS